uniref:Uncharacterized protein n=1 Tax=Anguilla anguilla TaxID=7936 RepID=A0A0E9RU46_ANGAN
MHRSLWQNWNSACTASNASMDLEKMLVHILMENPGLVAVLR